ncbi:MAG TPA: hypothetical protein VLE89_04745 [Chlamydiales bacterium]|nr:hypothetical protein [Chlamydiales bacterium]
MVCLLGALPQEGICLSNVGVVQEKFAEGFLGEVGDEERLGEKLEEMRDFFGGCENPVKEGRKLLGKFLESFNERYETNVSVNEALEMAKEKVPVVPVSFASRENYEKTLDGMKEQAASGLKFEERKESWIKIIVLFALLCASALLLSIFCTPAVATVVSGVLVEGIYTLVKQ